MCSSMLALFVFFMNMPYPPSDRVALVSFIILGSYDTSPKAVDTTAKAAGIDDEALKIVNNFWTKPQFRDSMAQQQIDAIIYAPHKRLLIESYPSRVSCRRDLYVPTFASGKDRVFATIRSDWEGSQYAQNIYIILGMVLSSGYAEVQTTQGPQGNYIESPKVGIFKITN